MHAGKAIAALAIVGGLSSYLAIVHATPPTTAPTSNNSRVVRDPVTGQVFRQDVINVNVPTTTWTTRPVTQTYYEPRYVTTNVPTQQTTYVPRTNYVLHQKIRGRWNPFRRTTVSYEYRPVTSWVPVTQTVSTPVTTQQWTKKLVTVQVPHPVQSVQTQQQIVHTEIPQPGVVNMVAYQKQPLFRIPILRRQRMLPWPARNQVVATQPATYVAPVSNPIVASNAYGTATSAAYQAPLRTASVPPQYSRDFSQAGLAPTELR